MMHNKNNDSNNDNKEEIEIIIKDMSIKIIITIEKAKTFFGLVIIFFNTKL